ncbi:hypothetical protein, partial [Nocardioides sp.]|uniref:hypothetical protein n=1 Tax=Nocardioides sp. TaxID=35761 RepID=UPI002736BCCE
VGAVVTGHVAARVLPDERRGELRAWLGGADHGASDPAPDDDARADPGPLESHPPSTVGDWGLTEELGEPGWTRRLDLGVGAQTEGALVVRGAYDHVSDDGLTLEHTEYFGAPGSPFEAALGSARSHRVVDGALVSLGVDDGFHYVPGRMGGPGGGSLACGLASRGPLAGQPVCLVADGVVLGVVTFAEAAAERPREELAAATREFRAVAASTRHLLVWSEGVTI